MGLNKQAEQAAVANAKNEISAFSDMYNRLSSRAAARNLQALVAFDHVHCRPFLSQITLGFARIYAHFAH